MALSEGRGKPPGIMFPGALRRALRWCLQAARTCRYLWTVRAAIPWPVKILLGLAMVLKCVPLDMGSDELVTVIAVLVLIRMRPGLVQACWRAAEIRA